MAAQILARNNHLLSRRSWSARRRSVLGSEQVEIDRDDALQAELNPKPFLKKPSLGSAKQLIEAPIANAAEALMGKMPKTDRIIIKSKLMKLTQSYEWKATDVALTPAGIFLAKPEEEHLRDLIPLYEVIEVKKRNEMPGRSVLRGDSMKAESDWSQRTSSVSTKKMSSLKLTDDNENAKLHIIQIMTVDDGCNSGRTYYFSAPSEELCNEWINYLRREVDRAVILKHAGPSPLKNFRFRLRRFHRGFFLQSGVAVLILASFVLSIVQNEFYSEYATAESNNASSTDSGESSRSVFDDLEYFLTCTFAFELLMNMMANLFRPFFQVASCCCSLLFHCSCRFPKDHTSRRAAHRKHRDCRSRIRAVKSGMRSFCAPNQSGNPLRIQRLYDIGPLPAGRVESV